MNGPNNTCVVVGESFHLSCTGGGHYGHRVHWQYQRPGEHRLRLLANNEQVFVETSRFDATLTPINSTHRVASLIVNDVTKSMDGTLYVCVYDGVNSCAHLNVICKYQNINPLNANLSIWNFTSLEGCSSSKRFTISKWVDIILICKFVFKIWLSKTHLRCYLIYF